MADSGTSPGKDAANAVRKKGPQMNMTIQELNQLLAPQGYKAVPFVNDLAEDVKMRPAPIEEVCRSHSATIKGLADLKNYIAPINMRSKKNIENYKIDPENQKDCIEIEQLFKKYWSDKSTTHNYHLIYSFVLAKKRHSPISILEIGLGTNNIDVPSNMGKNGKPGASLRAFRDWAPSARVVGADVDARILFTEDRIETYFVDQTKPETLDALARLFEPKSFDLIIDDGLHAPEANINTLKFALSLIRDDGTIIIEDVNENEYNFWDVAFSFLEPAYECHFIRSKSCAIIMIRRRGVV